MAEAWTNHLLGEDWTAYSAGTQPAGYVHPLAVKVMAEAGMDLSRYRSKSVVEFRETAFDLVFTVCDDAAENCPIWLGEGQVVHMSFPDPALAEGSEEERMAVFRQVRDSIRQEIIPYLEALSESQACSHDGEAD
jgi:arsenate reductase